MPIAAGVVAVQGDVSEHASALRAAGERHGREVHVNEVRHSGIVPECDLVVVPGGESTTISRLLAREGIDDELRAHVRSDRPILATCAGLIVLSRDPNDERVSELGLVDASVRRNAFGRQVDSFEAMIPVDGLDEPFPAVFIRAPIVESVGPGVEVLARWDDDPVAIRDGPVLGTAFHPELTGDSRIHDLAFFESTDVRSPIGR